MDAASTDSLREQPVARPSSHTSAQSTPSVMQPEQRRESDVALPPWQPDSEVTQCPVCGSQFTLFYRKHHCRRCGRVVCSACSPHRITIPHQFIVRPASEADAPIPGLTRNDTNSSSTSRNPALGGGQEVRVCNPCVPDPNFSPPPQYSQRRRSEIPFDAQAMLNYAPNRFPHIRHPVVEPPYRRRDNFDPDAQPLSRRDSRPAPDLFNAAQMPRFPVEPPFRRQDNFDPDAQPLSRRDSRPAPDLFNAAQMPRFPVDRHHPFPAPAPPPRHNHHHNIPSSSTSSRHPNEHPSSSYPEPTLREALRQTEPHRSWFNDAPTPEPHSRPIHGFYDSSEGVSNTMRFIDRRTMRQQPRPASAPVNEEDMCPACGKELPPLGPNGESEAREEHIRACIDACFTSPTAIALPRTSTSQSLPNRSPTRSTPSTRATSPAEISHSPAPGPTEVAESSTARHRFSLSRPSMFEYTASEKDCLDGDGKPAECIICFEEFEQGDRMGRLVCWCRFHRTCIRDWWERKGPGACPTHQLGV
ncbi:FYVE zinc finger-domain-containing protein [Clohesyomyces aquaticus]|uniref:RING-type E3 ubiquitin transferase n=1 Tax=Clohesyomyces aquaticus TaxID=1231657 RepID=A0A1Y1YFI4_9PLEO|nr:FYVE zinc finger-domain-containing protein [Clohesyomyces aquaticus]